MSSHCLSAFTPREPRSAYQETPANRRKRLPLNPKVGEKYKGQLPMRHNAIRERSFVLLATAALISTIQGCTTIEPLSTPYQPLAFRGGYRETLTDDGAYRLTFLFNYYTSRADAERFWHQRAAELCGGAEKYLYIPSDGPVLHPYPLRVEAAVSCKQPPSSQK